MASLISPEAFSSFQYDYVIAGGGTAGLTIANRLSENPQITVAILEAGQSRIDDFAVLTPGLAPTTWNNDSYDWIFHTTPQTHLGGHVVGHPRGKLLGGSSAINALFWTHASQADINDWGKLGNKGWSWKSLVPYFFKSETYVAPGPQTAKDLDIVSEIDASLHGQHGPVIDSFPEFYGSLQEAWPRTYKNLGLGVDGDPRGGLALGGFTNPTTIDPKTRTRSHAGVAYYKPIAGRPNLHVLTEALVEKVLFDPRRGRNQLIANGVKFGAKGRHYVVEAKKEVILSAGTFGSSKILELSGIGSTKILKKNNIEVLYDNENVGENLQDHALVPLGFEVVDGLFTTDAFRDPKVLDAALAAYLANQTGPLSTGTYSSALLSYKQMLPTSNKAKIPKGINNVLTPKQAAADPGLAHRVELTRLKTLEPKESSAQQLIILAGLTPGDANVTKLFSTESPGSYVTLAAILEHPFSRGSVHIQSSDPTVYPVIDPNYLGAEVDLEIFADIMLHLQTVARAEPLASLLKGKGHVYQPGYFELNESNVREHVKKALSSEYHPCGTCAMSPRGKGGVVDERLRVYGTERLRVVDASIFPLQARANLVSLTYAIAEKAADLIKEDAADNTHY
ncbi:hypothetical protein MMC22_010143 [Lobaria immixta]|nr:hypothetical protein [Lobaria immixta]